MANAPSPPWTLKCYWCDFSIIVNARGMHGKDQGSGVEAGNLMKDHIEEVHNKSWREFCEMLGRD